MSLEYWRGLAERFENQRDSLKQRVEQLEAVLLKIQTHQCLDENNCAMKSYEVLCDCQRMAEEALSETNDVEMPNGRSAAAVEAVGKLANDEALRWKPLAGERGPLWALRSAFSDGFMRGYYVREEMPNAALSQAAIKKGQDHA